MDEGKPTIFGPELEGPSGPLEGPSLNNSPCLLLPAQMTRFRQVTAIINLIQILNFKPSLSPPFQIFIDAIDNFCSSQFLSFESRSKFFDLILPPLF